MSKKLLSAEEHHALNELVDTALMGARWVSWSPEKHPGQAGERFLASEGPTDYEDHYAPATMGMPRAKGHPMTSYHSPDYAQRLDEAFRVVRRLEQDSERPLTFDLTRCPQGNVGWGAVFFDADDRLVGEANVSWPMGREPSDEWDADPVALAIVVAALRARRVELPSFLARF